MAQHTPGPWKASGNGVHAGSRCVAITHMEPREQRIDDALLIAAAPEMLAALKIISGLDIHHEALRIVDAAIVKAEGR